MAPGVSADAQDLKKLPRVVISSGGPYTAQSSSIQTFDDAIDVPREYATKPLALVATNGSLSSSGFSWVRMFLQPGGSDTNLQSGASELGRLLVDENSFLNSAQLFVDMTSNLHPDAIESTSREWGDKELNSSGNSRSIGALSILQIESTCDRWRRSARSFRNGIQAYVRRKMK